MCAPNMVKAFLLVFEPVQTWDGVARARRSFAAVLVTYLLPMILITAVAEGYGLVQWGKYVDVGYHGLRKFPVKEALVYEVMQAVLTLLVVITATMTLRSLGQTFHGRHNFAQAFTTIAHGLSPLFVLRLLDMFPDIGPWTSWTIGIVLCVAILYHGLPRVMLPDPPHAFGLYLMSCLLLVLATGLARFVTAWYLSGHFKPVERLISELAARLPF